MGAYYFLVFRQILEHKKLSRIALATRERAYFVVIYGLAQY